jgi:hypothetical protein
MRYPVSLNPAAVSKAGWPRQVFVPAVGSLESTSLAEVELEMKHRAARTPTLFFVAAFSVCAAAPTAVCAQSEAAGAARFEGESRCGNPTCHGASPVRGAPRWKSSRSQWLNRNIDHHSRAYATLETPEGKTIATYMGIEATSSEKCLVCHAPAAVVDTKDGRHQRKDGVSCEHCHGPAEFWLKPHTQKDWKQQKAQFAQRGFYDNADFKLRAEKCASCHVDIDHEIVAGGHPPLQFEMVAYAQIMKHWDDQRDLPADAFSVDPTLWSIGQVEGLRRAAEMIARRAGNANYQSIGKFSHFEDKNCYQCHHKLLDDAVRQAQGHYEMVDAIMASLFPDRREAVASAWNGVAAGVRSGAEPAEQAATRLAESLAPYEETLKERKVDREATKRILERLTSSGEKYKGIKRFSYGRPATSNVTRIDNIGAPWWYTTGAPEQTILAIESLCEPAFPGKCGANGIEPELRKLLSATDRFDYKPDDFSRNLSAIKAKLFR